MLLFYIGDIKTKGYEMSIMIESNVDPAETKRMDQLFKEAREREVSKEERAAQRLSWAYGNQPLDGGVSKDDVQRSLKNRGLLG